MEQLFKNRKSSLSPQTNLQPFPVITGNLHQSQIRQLILIMKALCFCNRGQGECEVCYKITHTLFLYYVNNLGRGLSVD